MFSILLLLLLFVDQVFLECVYQTKFGDTLEDVARLMGCGVSTAMKTPFWYLKNHPENIALSNAVGAGDNTNVLLKPNSLVYVPESCYIPAGTVVAQTNPASRRLVSCKPVPDCTNGNAKDVCSAGVCVDTDDGFVCACGDGKLATGNKKCSTRFSPVEGPWCVDTGCVTGLCSQNSCSGPTSTCVPDATKALKYRCECGSGYTLDTDGFKCVENNQCLVVPSVCAGAGSTCTNEATGHVCTCGPTHKVSTDKRSCLAQCGEGEEDRNGVCVAVQVRSCSATPTINCFGPTATCFLSNNVEKCKCESSTTYELVMHNATHNECRDRNECGEIYERPCGAARCVNKVGGFDCVCDDQTLVYDASVRDCVGKCPRSGCGGASAGTCDQQKGCQCNPGYEILPNSPPTKQFCSAKCDEKNFCSGNGQCIEPNKCSCVKSVRELDEDTCAVKQSYCRFIRFDLVAGEERPQFDGQSSVVYRTCGFGVRLLANGGVFDYFNNPNLEMLGVRPATMPADPLERGLLNGDESITVKFNEPAVLLDIDFNLGFSSLKEKKDTAELRLGSATPVHIIEPFWQNDGNEKITEFTVSVGNGDGFSFGSFTLINPNDPPDGETGVKQNIKIDLTESIESFFWLYILVAILAVLIILSAIVVWRRKQIKAALQSVRRTDEEMRTRGKTNAPIYTQDDTIVWDSSQGGTVKKNRDGTVTALSPAGDAIATKNARKATFI